MQKQQSDILNETMSMILGYESPDLSLALASMLAASESENSEEYLFCLEQLSDELANIFDNIDDEGRAEQTRLRLDGIIESLSREFGNSLFLEAVRQSVGLNRHRIIYSC